MDPTEYGLEPFRKDDEFILYRGKHRGNAGPASVFMLTPSSERPSPETIRKLEHEYALRDALESAWAIRPLHLCEHKGRPALILEDPGGETLDRLLPGPMEIAEFLLIATGLAAALSALHENGLIHKDIKPANVLVDTGTGQVRLTGFGIASRVPRERQHPAAPELIAGTLAYMAPEQTGRMNRSVDSRSDLYALGVTLYEMLTGSLPFTASDPMEWVHCHIARQPRPPGERLRDIPDAVSAIVMKLLAKTGEERYQTSAGVASDLRRCLAEWEARRRIDSFLPGQDDVSDRLLIPERLYGRASEIEALLASFDRIVAGNRPELVLVSGYSGIGKSSVVKELHKALVPPRGLFASGKFDQYKRDIPYATLAQAFQSLLRPLLSKSEAELSKWRSAILDAVGPNGRLILDLVPELRFVTGEQPPVPELPVQDAQRRFQLVFRRFISVFARPEHPLALFLDDLQWLDAATLDLLEDWLTRADVKHLMLIGAYRDNEVNSAHPLMKKIEAIRHAGVPVRDIVLTPLTCDDLARLIADSLHCDPDRAASLARLIHDKTAGNPFFAIQFLSTLAEEGVLAFDYRERRWSWELNRIHVKGYTDNVVDLMARKLSRLPARTQTALQLLASMGNGATFAMLRMVHEDSGADMHAQLWEAVRAGLVLRSEDSYRFLHDRVQEAAYAHIPEHLRSETHLRIGRLLAEHTASDDVEERIFEIVNQFNRGSHLITSSTERMRVAELNCIAGRRAKTSTAYESALRYLAAGRVLLSDDDWDICYPLIFDLEYCSAECEVLTADMVAAENRLAMLATRASTPRHIALVARLRLTLYTTLDRSDRGMEVCLEYLKRNGTDWSMTPSADEVRREYDRIWSQLGARRIEDLVDLPLMTKQECLSTLDVLTEAVTPALFCNENLSSLVICRMVNLSLEYGNSDGSCFAYVWLAIIAGPRFDAYEEGFRFGLLGYDLVEKRGLTRYQARTYMSFGNIVMPWTKHIRGGRDFIRRAFDAANRIGDLTFAAYCCNELVTNLLAVGDPLPDVMPQAEESLEFATNTRFGLVIDFITTQLRLIRTLLGLTPVFGHFDDDRFDEGQFEHHLAANPVLSLAEFWYWTRKIQARFLAGDHISAIDASLKAQRLLWSSPSQFETAEFRYYGALSHAASWDAAIGERKQQHLDALAAHHRQLQTWAAHCPDNFENRAALIGAELARIEGREYQAMRLYKQAIRSAHANGFVHNEAIAYELAAQFYAARGFDKIANTYMQEAKYGYLRWGAAAKVKQLDELYPDLQTDKATPDAATRFVAPVGHFDLETVVKVSQAISGEIVPERLIDTVMRLAIEHAGAERGFLIVPRGAVHSIEAEATTSGDTIRVRRLGVSRAADHVPESVIQYVLRTQSSVIIDDASGRSPFADDPYFGRQRTRSVMCLPLVNQTKLIGVLYLENNLTSRVFKADRIRVLEVLASQAAISLENTRLYSDLAEREARIRRLVDANIMGVFIWNMDGAITAANDAFLHLVQFDRDDLLSGRVQWTDLTPSEWRARDEEAIAELKATATVAAFEKEFLRKDGGRTPVLFGAALFEGQGAEGVAFVVDLTEQKRAEEQVTKNEERTRLILDDALDAFVTMDANGLISGWNSQAEAMFGWSREQAVGRRMSETIIPARYREAHEQGLRQFVSNGRNRLLNRRLEMTAIARDGREIPVEFAVTPVRLGETWTFGAFIRDITERRRAQDALENAFREIRTLKDQLHRENLALRDEVDRASMFEEIVGTSAALQEVLSRIAKVAPTDSTVFITGETGTGKELIARAVHKRSRRSAHAFVSVNCAAIAPSLIHSELFGHEKGSFTGATQRRLGRFELADGGTIFLDEVGELPPDTQLALLRVLQEREIERVGGIGPVDVDVRVIAATNRDLQAAIDAGSFRADLFYRLNVFPIEVPPLRERNDDIVMLLEYFVKRYATRAGKDIKSIDKKTVEIFQAYDWPGNIRELQNVVERSVIVSSGDVFSIDESWLAKQSSRVASRARAPLSILQNVAEPTEREMIEAVLAESLGRVSGPSGAAAKLGIPPSTLESRIKALKIQKRLFKFGRRAPRTGRR